jgi:hypothetical protein
MHLVRPSRRMWAGAVGVLALGGSALLPTIAAAQTPAPPPPPAAVGECPPPPSAAQIADMQERFAADLAAALGQSPADVQRALEATAPQRPPPGLGEPGQVVTLHEDLAALVPAAAQLGVTAQALADALQAAMPAQVCLQIAVAGADAATEVEDTTVAVDMAPLFATVAERLGGGITAAQVEAALRLVRPAPEHHAVAVSVSPALVEEHLGALARALAVSVEELTAALQSIGRGGIIFIRDPRAP